MEEEQKMMEFDKHEARVYRVACVIADGMSCGNEQYDNMPEGMRERCTWAADNILRHFILEPVWPHKAPEFDDQKA